MIHIFAITGTADFSSIQNELKNLERTISNLRVPPIKTDVATPDFSKVVSAAKSAEKQATIKIKPEVDQSFSGGISSFLNSEKGKFNNVGKELGQNLTMGMQQQFGMLGGMASSVAQALGPIGIAAGVAGAGILALGVSSASAAKEWQSLMAGVGKTTGLEGNALAQLSDQLMDLSTKMPVARAELAQIAQVGGTLGVKQSDIPKFVQDVSEAAAGWQMPAEDAANTIAGISNAFKIPISQAANFGSVINTMADSVGGSEAQIGDFLIRASGIANTFNEGIPATAAFGATLASINMPMEVAATGLQSMMAYAQADPKRMTAWADMLGISVEDLNKKLSDDLYGTLIDSSDAISSVGGETEQLQKRMQLWGEGGSRVSGGLAGMKEKYDAAKAEANRQMETGESLHLSFDIQKGTLDSQITMLQNSFSNILIGIGEPMLAPLTEGVSMITSGLNIAQSAAGALVGAFTNTSAFQNMASIAGTIGTTFTTVGNTILSTFSQIGTAINSSMGGDALGKIAEVITTPLAVSLGIVNELVSLIGSGVVSGWEAVSEVVSEVIGYLQEASAYIQAFAEVTGISDAFDDAKKSVTDLLDKLGEIKEKVSDGLTAAIPTMISGLQTALASLATQFGSLISSALAGPLGEVASALGLGDVAAKLGAIDARAQELLTTTVSDSVASGASDGLASGAEAAKGAITDSTKSAVEDAYEEVAKASKEFSEKYGSQYAAGMTNINGKWVSNQRSASFYSDKLLRSGEYSTFANGDVAWKLFEESKSGKSNTMTAVISIDGTEYTREFSTLVDNGERAAKKIKAEFRDVAIDIPKYIKNYGSDVSDSLSNALSDGVISFTEKDELRGYLKSLEQTSTNFPVEFKAANLDELKRDVQATVDGVAIKINLDAEAFAISAAEYIDEHFGLYSKMYETGYVAQKPDEEAYFKLMEGYKEKGDDEVVQQLQDIDTLIETGDRNQAEVLNSKLEYVVKAHPELIDQTAFLSRVALADETMLSTTMVQNGHLSFIQAATDSTSTNTKDTVVAINNLANIVGSGGFSNTVTNAYAEGTIANQNLKVAQMTAPKSTGSALKFSTVSASSAKALAEEFGIPGFASGATKIQPPGGLAFVGEGGETEYIFTESQIKGLYPESSTVEKGSMRYILESLPMQDYPYSIQKPTGYQYSKWPDAPNVSGSGNVPRAWLSDEQTSGMDYISSEIRQIQLDAIKTGAGSVVPYWMRGEVKQPDWWVQAATALSPKYASNWAASKGGTVPEIVPDAETSKAGTDDRLTVRDAYFKTYGDSFCIDPVEPDQSLNYIPSASYLAGLAKKDGESTRAAIAYLYGENFTEGCIKANDIPEGVFTPSNELLEEVARSQGASLLGAGLVGSAPTGTSNNKAIDVLESIDDNTKDTKLALNNQIDILKMGIFATPGMQEVKGTFSTSGPNDLVTGLSKEGYVVSYDPRTDTCEGMAFNAPDPSLKTTDKFYLGLTENSPYRSEDKASGYGWENVAQTNDENLQQLMKINEESQKTSESSEATAENTQDVYRTLGQQYALQQQALALSGATLDATGALVSMVSGSTGSTGLYGKTAGSFWGGLSKGGGGGWVGTGASMSGWGAQASQAATTTTSTGAYSVNSGSVGSVQWADGGFANQPTFGVFGEAGREAFVPISDRAAGRRILPQVMRELGVPMFAAGGIVGGGRSSVLESIGPTNITYAPTINANGLNKAEALSLIEKSQDKFLAKVAKKQVLAAKRRG